MALISIFDNCKTCSVLLGFLSDKDIGNLRITSKAIKDALEKKERREQPKIYECKMKMFEQNTKIVQLREGLEAVALSLRRSLVVLNLPKGNVDNLCKTLKACEFINAYLCSQSWFRRLFYSSDIQLEINVLEEHFNLNAKLIQLNKDKLNKGLEILSTIQTAFKILRKKGKFARAIKNDQLEEVKKFLKEGTSAKLRVDGANRVSCAHYTPYLCARDFSCQKEIVALLEKADEGFSEKFIKMRLLSLCFEISTDFVLEGQVFSGNGLDHFSYHEYLIPSIVHSLSSFFDQYSLNSSVRQKVICAIREDSFKQCLSCVEEKASTIEGKDLILLSDTVFNHSHWITLVASRFLSLIAIGNRGSGCENNPGVAIYKIHKNEDFSKKTISLFHQYCSKDPSKKTSLKESSIFSYLELPKQRSGSCSRKSLEAGILATIFFALYETHGKKVDRQALKMAAENIFEMWWKYDQILQLNQIMEKEQAIGYDPNLLINVLAAFDACPKTAEKFYNFLFTQGQLDESDINSKKQALLALAIDRNNELIIELLHGKSLDFNTPNAKKKLPLSLALGRGNFHMAERLVACGAKINLDGLDGTLIPPLWDAALNNNTEALKWLLEHGANPGSEEMTRLYQECLDREVQTS